jgi:hypothetical protein
MRIFLMWAHKNTESAQEYFSRCFAFRIDTSARTGYADCFDMDYVEGNMRYFVYFSNDRFYKQAINPGVGRNLALFFQGAHGQKMFQT